MASSLVNAQYNFLLDVSLLIQRVNILGEERGEDWKVSGGELWRPQFAQDHYRNTGKSRVLRSKHQDRLAIDLNLFINGEYQTDSRVYEPLGEYWESLTVGNKWGGRWGWDGNHFEATLEA